MVNTLLINSIRFLFLAFFQVFILNNLEIGWGIYPMIYPLFILLLPFEMSTILLLVISFFFGLTIDSFSNTFGLHTSAALIFAYFRPLVFKLFAPRDGYENVETSTVYAMGFRWFLSAVGLLLLIHHTWFFMLEVFKWNEFGLIVTKIVCSVPLTFGLFLLVQFIFSSRKATIR